MALAEAVLLVAQAMEEEGSDPNNGEAFNKVLKGFARELRTAIKASESNQSVDGFPRNKQARKEYLNELNRQVMAEESPLLNQEMVELVGSPSLGEGQTLHPFSTNAPLGSFVPIASEVFQYRQEVDDSRPRLYYHEGQTKRWQEHLEQQQKASQIVAG